MTKLNSFINALPIDTKLTHYQIKDILGQGSFGITYRANDPRLRRTVAIKEFFPEEFVKRGTNGELQLKSASNASIFKEGTKSFLNEAQNLAMFRHQNIVQVYSIFKKHNTIYMVMEFEKGNSLVSACKRKTHWSEEELLNIVLPLLDGLKTIHSKDMIHRDIKPANIYIREDNSPVLLDFGAARQVIGEQSKTLTRILTPGYAPMEQYLTSSKTQGPWTDIYALGAVLYRILTGKKPEDAASRSSAAVMDEPDPHPLAVEVGKERYSHAFLQAIDHAMEILTKNRPQNVETWKKELQNGIV